MVGWLGADEEVTHSGGVDVADGVGAVRVAVVDDHRTFTDLVGLALRTDPDLDFVGAAHDGDGARRLVAACRPDLVLMDVQLGNDDGLDLTAELLADDPELVVVVLTGFGDGSVMRRAAAVGASALLPKDGTLPDLLDGLREARRGGLVVHPELLRILVSDGAGSPGAAPELTGREREVLGLLAAGHTVQVIAKELGISVHTCRGHVHALLSKLDVHSQLEAVVVAVTRGLIDAPRAR